MKANLLLRDKKIYLFNAFMIVQGITKYLSFYHQKFVISIQTFQQISDVNF